MKKALKTEGNMELARKLLKEVEDYAAAEKRDEEISIIIFDKAEALYIFLSQNHEGQMSEKYQMLCSLTRPGVFWTPHHLTRASISDEARAYLDKMEA